MSRSGCWFRSTVLMRPRGQRNSDWSGERLVATLRNNKATTANKPATGVSHDAFMLSNHISLCSTETRPLHSKWHEVYAGFPGIIISARYEFSFRQTGKGPRHALWPLRSQRLCIESVGRDFQTLPF